MPIYRLNQSTASFEAADDAAAIVALDKLATEINDDTEKFDGFISEEYPRVRDWNLRLERHDSEAGWLFVAARPVSSIEENEG